MNSALEGPIVVTGAGGFVGQHLLRELGEAAVASSVDVTDGDAVAAEIGAREPRAVVHLAARSSGSESWKRPAGVWHVNVVGTVNVLSAGARVGARVLVVSTGEVYGRAETVPTPETAPVAPISPYAASKAGAELACDRARRVEGLEAIVARPFPHTGPGQDERFAIGSWTHQVARLEEEGGGTLRVGDLSVRRDLTDVRDVCRAYRLLLDPGVTSDVYNVASGRAVSLETVAATLLALARCPISLQPEPARKRPFDLPVLCGDPSRLRERTGWAPTVSLEQTLADALAAARDSVRRRRTPAT